MNRIYNNNNNYGRSVKTNCGESLCETFIRFSFVCIFPLLPWNCLTKHVIKMPLLMCHFDREENCQLPFYSLLNHFINTEIFFFLYKHWRSPTTSSVSFYSRYAFLMSILLLRHNVNYMSIIVHVATPGVSCPLCGHSYLTSANWCKAERKQKKKSDREQ